MRFSWFLLSLSLIAGIGYAQSLAEVAEKERERREKLPPSKVIRDEDLAASGGRTLSLTGKEGDQRTVAEILDGEDAEAEEEPTSDWPQVLADCPARYDAAEHARNERLYLIQKGLPIGADLERIPCSVINSRGFIPGWVRHALDCERLAEEAKEKQALMDQIQEECLNEARIRSVPPGAARLQ